MNEIVHITQFHNDEELNSLLVFISDTADGKYTESKPQIAEVTFNRVAIPEQDRTLPTEDTGDEVLLFGISS